MSSVWVLRATSVLCGSIFEYMRIFEGHQLRLRVPLIRLLLFVLLAISLPFPFITRCASSFLILLMRILFINRLNGFACRIAFGGKHRQVCVFSVQHFLQRFRKLVRSLARAWCLWLICSLASRRCLFLGPVVQLLSWDVSLTRVVLRIDLVQSRRMVYLLQVDILLPVRLCL